MITTITGANNYMAGKKLAEITGKFVEKYGDLALERLDAEETEAKKLVEALQSLPFLAKKRLIVVRNGSLNKDFAEQIEQIISSIPETNDILFHESNLDRRTAYFKVLKSQTEFEDFGEQDARGLANWLVNEAKKAGGELSFSDANYLVERLGADQNLLSNELAKLLLYKPRINRQNIDLLTELTPKSQVFELLDAAFSGRKDKALQLYDDQRAQKVEPQAILAMIAWQLQRIAIVKMAGERKITEVSRESGLSEYPLRKAQATASKLSQNDLQRLVNLALDIDYRSKTSALDLDEALKTYIISI